MVITINNKQINKQTDPSSSLFRSNAESILVSMGQGPELAANAQIYINIIMPNIFLSFTITAIRKFLQGLGS
jgi:Na+-driven multidrug efflux pump